MTGALESQPYVPSARHDGMICVCTNEREQILSILLNVLVMVSTHYGAGQHFWNLEADEMAEGLKVRLTTASMHPSIT